MKQLLIPEDCVTLPTYKVTGKEYHYLRRVRRLKIGDTVLGTDGKQNFYSLTVMQIEKNSLVLKVEKIPRSKKSTVKICLFQSLPKGRRMDQIVRQSTELGVDKIVPIITDFTLVAPRSEDFGQRILRWRRIAREAMQQSGSAMLPCITAPESLQDILRREEIFRDSRTLFFHHDSLNGQSLHDALANPATTINIFIGPEGGFSPQEVENFHQFHIEPIKIGENILRTETAAVVVTAAIKIITCERMHWHPIEPAV